MGFHLGVSRGRANEEDIKICALDQLIPDDYRQALDEKMDLVTYAQRLQYVKTRLGLIKHRQLAQAVDGAQPASREQQPTDDDRRGERACIQLAQDDVIRC